MSKNKFHFLEEKDAETIQIISGKKFTLREVDIISCIINGRTSKKTIAQTLSISPRTVNTHTRNILLKLECSSWENIREFIEKSDSLLLLRKHYILLLMDLKFEQLLQSLSSLIKKPLSVCLVQCEQAETFLLSSKIEHFLHTVGIQTYLQNQDGVLPIGISEHAKVILLGNTPEPSEEVTNGIYINCQSYENDYLLVLDILKKILDDRHADKLLREFVGYSNGIQGFGDDMPNPQRRIDKESEQSHSVLRRFWNKNKKTLIILGIFIAMGFFLSLFFPFRGNIFLSISPVRSDFVIPLESILLQRPDLIESIEDKLSTGKGIAKVGLVGMGGVGKTTAARLMGRTYKGPVVWEINAETPLSLRNSFNDLAYALARTMAQKEDLNFIQNISNQDEKDKQILSFVKARLKEYPHWLLIYDNIESLQDIQMYLPEDPLVWGEGNVIVTTRNINIKDSFYVQSNHIVHLKELNPSETYFLLTRILYGSRSLSQEEKKEAILFLKNIPSFPLDVSVAANYIKNTHIAYGEYLKRMRQQNFHLEQEALLKEVSHDIKTRYGIIALSIQHIVESNKDFTELLLMASLMDSIDIPKEMLEAHSSKFTVDKFMHQLNKYSLITSEAFIENTSTFSIHRSIQEISLSYLKSTLKLGKSSKILADVLKTIENYMSNTLDQENISKITLLETHAQRLYNNPLLTESMQGTIGVILSGLQAHLEKDEVKIKPFLEKNLIKLQTAPLQNTMRVAQAFTYLGDIYRSLGDYEKSIMLLEQSLYIYEKNDPNSLGFARALLYLGNTYRQKGYYDKAKACLIPGLAIYKKWFKNLSSKGLADTLIYLGLMYRDLGEYQKAKDALKEGLNIHKNYNKNPLGSAWPSAYLASSCIELGEYQKAKSLLEGTLLIFNKTYGEDSLHAAWVLAYLGGVNKELGNYKEAKSLLEKGRLIYETNKSEIYVYFKVLLTYLGRVYSALDDSKKAQEALEKSLVLLEKHYGKGHVQTARTLNSLGDLYLKERQFEKAEGFLHKAFDIYKQNNHTDIYVTLESLSTFYALKAKEAQSRGNMVAFNQDKKQSADYLKQALECVQSRLPKDSIHTLRIQSKLKSFS